MYNIRKRICIILTISALIIFGGCENKNLANFGSNIDVTYAAENGGNALNADSPANTAAQYSASSGKNNAPILLSSYSTKFNKGNIGRKNNISLAAKLINGTVVYPGNVFSFNETVGPTSKRNGFSLATIFNNGKELKGYGGGVCQVSSTLYNAADKAGLEIIERHPHSKRVYYVPKNRDAATSYGGIDFKFKNVLLNPVIISTAVTEGSLTVNFDIING